MGLYLGIVTSVYDHDDGQRIKVRIATVDRTKSDEHLAYAFPFLPKIIYVKPKVGEFVLIMCEDDEKPDSQRYYIGPIIAQPQFMNSSIGNFNGTALLNSSIVVPSEAPRTDPNSKGAFAKEEDVAIYGRENTEVILSEDNAYIRCGVRTLEGSEIAFNRNVTFNKKDGTYVKLNYDSKGKEYKSSRNTKRKSHSTATVVADDINLISNQGEPWFNTGDRDKMISDNDMSKILEKAHVLPYGDVLVEILSSLWQVFLSHTHQYSNMPPVQDSLLSNFNSQYGTGQVLKEKLLSEHVRIN